MAAKSPALKSGRRRVFTKAATLARAQATIPDPDNEGAIRVEVDGALLDLGESSVKSGIVPQDMRSGIGILVEGRKNVVIQNARISGYKHNIVVRNCRNVTVCDSDLSGSRAQVLFSKQKYDPRDWVDIFKPKIWRTYGAGLVLENCRDCRVENVRANNAQNGLWLVNCRGCVVTNCDFSHNSGWGVWMWRSKDNKILFNNCDWCVRCEDPKRYSAGGDSAGIMLSNDNCRNLFAHNTFRYSGDGFFLSGLWVRPSNDNIIAMNDGSHSPHNAFEVTHSVGNVLVGNVASNSRFGLWLGYGRNYHIASNIIENCYQWGISIDRGSGNTISGNEIRRCERGIVLFSHGKKGPASSAYEIDHNLVESCDVGVTLSGTSHVRMQSNTIACDRALELVNSTRHVRARGNNIEFGKAPLAAGGVREIDLAHNFWGSAQRARGVRSAARKSGAQDGAVIVDPVSNSVHKHVEMRVAVSFADNAFRRDKKFRWYKGTKHLIGTAEL
jgi:parallel beta-helix repeat protein